LKPSLLYRISSVVLVLFAAGHTFGFRQADPKWGAEPLLALMRSLRFDTQGFTRSYWDFFVGFGLFASVFLIFAAVLAWQLGGLDAETLRRVRDIRWALAISFVGVTILTCRYFFLIPIIFATVTALCLIAAAWLSPKAA
jgi:hypothetical protein